MNTVTFEVTFTSEEEDVTWLSAEHLDDMIEVGRDRCRYFPVGEWSIRRMSAYGGKWGVSP